MKGLQQLKQFGLNLLIVLMFMVGLSLITDQGPGDWGWHDGLGLVVILLAIDIMLDRKERKNRVVVVTRYANETDVEVEKMLLDYDWPEATVDLLMKELRRSGYGFWRRRKK